MEKLEGKNKNDKSSEENKNSDEKGKENNNLNENNNSSDNDDKLESVVLSIVWYKFPYPILESAIFFKSILLVLIPWMFSR